MIRALGILFFIAISVNNLFADDVVIQKSAEDDRAKIAAVVTQCSHLKDYVIKNRYSVECNEEYMLFGNNPSLVRPLAKSAFKIANYNLLHPGTSKALFKDYFLVAKVANSFDFVSAEEVLSLVGHDAQINAAIDAQVESLPNDSVTKDAKNLYRIPGYLKLLNELKKLDPSWSLILSPRGDAALQGSVEEHVGFYFRSSIVSPKVNKYCDEMSKASNKIASVACLIDLGAQNKFVSRRPFMGSFKAKNFNFTVVASHVVYNFSGDDEQAKVFAKSVFGKSTVEEIGNGVNSVNFARFGEVKLTMEFIKNYSEKYNDKKVIFSADMNLTPELEYWKEILSINDGSSLLITDPTTISPQRFNKAQEETNGVANSYDHFILNKEVFKECDNGHVYNYYNSAVQGLIDAAYIIREPVQNKNKSFNFVVLPKDDDVPPVEDGTIKLDYPLTKSGQDKMDKFVDLYSAFLQNLKTVKGGKIVPDDYQVKERIDGLKNRLFLKQLTNPFYYRFYQEILSDHFPAYITCQI